MKKYLLGIISLVLAVSISAFTPNHEAKAKKMFTNYYGFEGTSNSQVGDSDRWVSLGTELPEECHGDNIVCIVTASETSLSAFKTAIHNANPQDEIDLENMSGVAIFSKKP